MCQIVVRPARTRSEAQETGKREPWWRGKASSQIAFPVASSNGVDSERHDVKFGGLGALYHAVIQSPVLVEIKLEHFRSVDHCPYFFNTHSAEGRHAKHRPILLCSS